MTHQIGAALSRWFETAERGERFLDLDHDGVSLQAGRNFLQPLSKTRTHDALSFERVFGAVCLTLDQSIAAGHVPFDIEVNW